MSEQTIYVVQDSMFGDYGNGEIYGAFTDQREAAKLAQEKGEKNTDVIPATLHGDLGKP